MTSGEARVIRRQWWAWAIVVLVVAAAVAPLVHTWLTNPDDQRLVDLDVYRTGGQMLLEGRPVYDYVTPAPQLLPFTYPPIAAMLAVLLAGMSWETAQWVWTAGIFVALAVTVGFSFRRLLERQDLRKYAPWLFALLMVVCTYLMPIRDQVRFGQVDILLVALCLADCVAKRPWWPRGFLIGLATAVKLTPGVFLIYLLVTRQWRTFFMASFAAGGAHVAAVRGGSRRTRWTSGSRRCSTPNGSARTRPPPTSRSGHADPVVPAAGVADLADLAGDRGRGRLARVPGGAGRVPGG
ncbi:hypothetical protein GCM10020220_054560 [Nonomuraea rubra]|uniref:glycosyltransferase family 87 protein n=1 Tax=Nonomuraea rubra TaxID=46180 RepID=UPI0031E785FD